MNLRDKPRKIELLNMDLTVHKEFKNFVAAGNYLGAKVRLHSIKNHKGKKSPYITVKHRTTKQMFYARFKPELP